MKRVLALVVVVTILVYCVFALSAKPSFVEAKVGPSGQTVKIPQYAIEVAPGVFSLGTAVHEGKLVEGYAFVDYREPRAKPTGCNYDGRCQGFEDASCQDCQVGTAESSCYSFLSKGAKWRSVEPYIVNPANSHGLDQNQVFSNFEGDIAKWEGAAGREIVAGGSTTQLPLVADTRSPDGQNEVYFGPIEDQNAIAITIVWGIFSGNPASRELVEWDQVYDNNDFSWSLGGEAGKMDFENIATHELGHTMGLNDLYTSGCSEETMYGYASEGETKKRDLGAGDVTGVRALYSN